MSGPFIADALLVAVWLLLVADLLRAARRLNVSRARRTGGVLLLVGMLAAGHYLESATGGRLVWQPGVAAAGVVAAGLGLGLHCWARRTLARGWSPSVSPRPDGPLVGNGPYAHIRHPLYAAIVLVGMGTLAAHCSRATLAATLGLVVGIAIKRRLEDRALERRFGERWRDYARQVPAFYPRVSRGSR